MNNKLSRARRLAPLVFCAVALASSMEAQQPAVAPAELGQIADAVLAELIPPGQGASRVPVASRGLFFDHARTMAAFGHAGAASGSATDLNLRSRVSPGSRLLLRDCDPAGTKPCNELGWGVYVWIEPITMGTSQALVRAHLRWPDRGPVAFQAGVAPKGLATLVGFSADLYLIRTQEGNWQFETRGRTRVYE